MNTLKALKSKIFGNIYSNVISFLLGILIGFSVYSYLINNGVIFSREIVFNIDPFEIISAGITIVIGVFILRKIGKKDDQDKTKKDRLVKLFSDFDDEFTDVVRKIAKGTSKLDYIASILKRYRMKLEKLSDLAVNENLVSKECETLVTLKENVRILHTSLTDTPKNGAIEDGIRLTEDGIIQFSEIQKDKIANTVTDINCSIYKLGIDIYKS